MGKIHIAEVLGHERRGDTGLDQGLQREPGCRFVAGLGSDVPVQLIEDARQRLADCGVVAADTGWFDVCRDCRRQLR